jgi:hypothetical protein
MSTTLEKLEKRIEKIELRNNKVEADKAWEGSLARKLLIVVFTYVAIGLYLKFVIGIDPILNAIVPATGFLLSTLTLPFFKDLWKRHIYKK